MTDLWLAGGRRQTGGAKCRIPQERDAESRIGCVCHRDADCDQLRLLRLGLRKRGLDTWSAAVKTQGCHRLDSA
jgi:hypothetical protein